MSGKTPEHFQIAILHFSKQPKNASSPLQSK